MYNLLKKHVLRRNRVTFAQFPFSGIFHLNRIFFPMSFFTLQLHNSYSKVYRQQIPACLPFSDKFLRELLFCIKFGHFAISFKQVLLNSSSSIFRNYQVCNNTNATLIQEQTQVPIVVLRVKQIQRVVLPGIIATVFRARKTRKVRSAARLPKSIPIVMYLQI